MAAAAEQAAAQSAETAALSGRESGGREAGRLALEELGQRQAALAHEFGAFQDDLRGKLEMSRAEQQASARAAEAAQAAQTRALEDVRVRIHMSAQRQSEAIAAAGAAGAAGVASAGSSAAPAAGGVAAAPGEAGAAGGAAAAVAAAPAAAGAPSEGAAELGVTAGSRDKLVQSQAALREQVCVGGADERVSRPGTMYWFASSVQRAAVQ